MIGLPEKSKQYFPLLVRRIGYGLSLDPQICRQPQAPVPEAVQQQHHKTKDVSRFPRYHYEVFHLISKALATSELCTQAS